MVTISAHRDYRLIFVARGGCQFSGKLHRNFDLPRDEVELRCYLFGELFSILKNCRSLVTRQFFPCLTRRFPTLILVKNEILVLP
ncbi:hypothetical protein C1893_17405 [Pseudomonas sp. MPR-ANC1]|nr:hypothetical protein C1893_17405 [Pseudomonas sp. MPR-ANC1]